MMSVARGPAPEAPQPTVGQSGTDAPAKRAACPECLTAFKAKVYNQLFCTVAHREAFNARIAVRGKVIQPLDMVARITREGTRGDVLTGKRATADRNALLRMWKDDDAAAGRMAWTDYLARRYAIGFDPLA